LRYDLFTKLEEVRESEGLSDIAKITEAKFTDLWSGVWKTFESVRCDIFNFMMSNKDKKTDYTKEEAKRIMQQAYVTWARPTEDEKKKNKWSQFSDDVT